MSVSITFLGAAGTVTGSKYLVQHAGQQLLVDCGLFQGYKSLREMNWEPLPVPASRIDAVVLTHAHLDHSGYLPLLTRQGYAGAVHCTAGTRDLCGILLPDSGHLQEEEASYLNRHRLSRHDPALPLYTRLDAVHSLRLLQAHPLHQPFEPLPGWRARFFGAGHILGAASVLLEVGGQRILFSGDLGRPDDPLMLPPEAPPAADVVLIESTYGDREHPALCMEDELAPALTHLAAHGGVAVVPVFAVGRAQQLMLAIARLKAQNRIPANLPVYLDSPMAVSATQLLGEHMGAHRLTAAELHTMTQGTTLVRTTDESKALARLHGPRVILAASGMATGGRVLHHLALHAGHHRNLILLTGYQTPGTRGARLAAGEKSVRMLGQEVAIRAKVQQLHSASAHADATQLIGWLGQMPSAPGKVFVVHGDMGASDALRQRIEHTLHWRAQVPHAGASYIL